MLVYQRVHQTILDPFLCVFYVRRYRSGAASVSNSQRAPLQESHGPSRAGSPGHAVGGNFRHLSHSWYSWMFIPPVSQSYGNRFRPIPIQISDIWIKLIRYIPQCSKYCLRRCGRLEKPPPNTVSEGVWSPRNRYMDINHSYGWIYVTLCAHSLGGAYPNKHGGVFLS